MTFELRLGEYGWNVKSHEMREFLAVNRSIILTPILSFMSRGGLDVQRIENASIGAFFNASLPAFSLRWDFQFSRFPSFMTLDPFFHFKAVLAFHFSATLAC